MKKIDELNTSRNTSNCDDCKLKQDCRYFYPCEFDNKMEDMKMQLIKYKTAWATLKDFVSDLQEGHENTYAYSNEYIEYIEDEIEDLDKRLQL